MKLNTAKKLFAGALVAVGDDRHHGNFPAFAAESNLRDAQDPELTKNLYG